MNLFCFSCKYFYCHIFCEENRNHDDHSGSIINLPLENFEFARYFGAGKNRCVFRVIDFENGQGHALKIIPKVTYHWEIELLSSKMELSLQISHPNIIEYKSSYHIKEESLFVIIRELADKPATTIWNHIHFTKQSFFLFYSNHGGFALSPWWSQNPAREPENEQYTTKRWLG